MATTDIGLHGKIIEHQALEAGEYEIPEEYADQGDTRVIRDLMFSYNVVTLDPAGNEVLEPREAYRNQEVTIEQIGLIALEKGERHHSFYTNAELDVLRSGGIPQSGRAALPKSGLSELGEYELVDWLNGEAEGQEKAPTVNEVLESIGDDKELAHRTLQAENIRSDGDPRKGLEQGLHRIISGS